MLAEKASLVGRNLCDLSDKVHVSETCDDASPNVITHVEMTMATDQDVTVVDTIHQALEQQHCAGLHLTH